MKRSRPPTVAFVLSGGAALGAIQVGMLRALYEREIVPDLIVGTSAGALNGAFIASRRQTATTADALGDIWRGLRRGQAFPLNPLTGLLGFLGARAHLVPESGLRRLVERHVECRALELGAERVYVLPTGYACALEEPPGSALGMALHAISLLTHRRLVEDVERHRDDADLIVLPPPCPLRVTPIDFGHADELIARALDDARAFLDSAYRTLKPSPARRPMSFVSPITNRTATSMKPTTLARSMTENGIGRPRIFSASAQKMCPPSSGRNGNRLTTASDSEISARM